jgi:sugar O-acyltransferase (sialic acid O-acetyltransferase NeuD family)
MKNPNMINKPIALIGSGGLGREVRALLERTHEFAGFYDDKANSADHLGTLDRISNTEYLNYLIAIGAPKIKRHIAQKLTELKLNYTNLISEKAVFNPDFANGNGNIICDGVATTVDISIGSHVLVNLNVTIGHDVIIGNYCSIMPGAMISGNVTIGEATLIGSGAVILQGLTIGANCRVGAGAVVTKDVPDGATVVGIPARIV